MAGPVSTESAALAEGLTLTDLPWELARSAPGQCASPEEAAPLRWYALAKGGPVATARLDGEGEASGLPSELDNHDWWMRCTFTSTHTHGWINAEGLATLGEAWLNGAALFRFSNMFRAHGTAVTLQTDANTLVLVFRALRPELRRRRPRPRWRVPMLEDQQLRWLRTTLLGRCPGWSPPLPPVGPWRPITLTPAAPLRWRAQASVDRVRGCGRLSIEVDAPEPGTYRIELRAPSDNMVLATAALTRTTASACITLEELTITPWWPHTHGAPACYELVLYCDEVCVAKRRVGFRELAWQQDGSRFNLTINGATVFVRGVVWNPLDLETLAATAEAYRHALAQLAAAGLNMIRVPGTHVYEQPAFYEACDELGLLVWQDFMFANCDYPTSDSAWQADALAECREVLARLADHACLAMWCGNSEAAQQAAMMGASKPAWASTFFDEELATLVRAHKPDASYVPSSASGGAFPFLPTHGPTSYYGVGAYLRPLDDARLAGVRFASECLAFANVPEPATLASLPGGVGLRPHHPAWKARVPRDLGAGWDFDDVRDHYVQALFGQDPVALRARDPERYLHLGRLASATAMAGAMQRWRRQGSGCGGALILAARDLAPGMGWGIIDALGRPKAPWYALKHVLAPRAILLHDDGLAGLTVELVNDRPTPWQGELRLTLFGPDGVQLGLPVSRPMTIAARASAAINAVALLDYWADLTYAYRFGPPAVGVVHVAMRSETEDDACQACHFPTGWAPALMPVPVGWQVTHALEADRWAITVTADRAALGVCVESQAAHADHAYVALAPHLPFTFRLPRSTGAARLWAVSASTSVNLKEPAP